MFYVKLFSSKFINSFSSNFPSKQNKSTCMHTLFFFLSFCKNHQNRKIAREKSHRKQISKSRRSFCKTGSRSISSFLCPFYDLAYKWIRSPESYPQLSPGTHTSFWGFSRIIFCCRGCSTKAIWLHLLNNLCSRKDSDLQ